MPRMAWMFFATSFLSLFKLHQTRRLAVPAIMPEPEQKKTCTAQAVQVQSARRRSDGAV